MNLPVQNWRACARGMWATLWSLVTLGFAFTTSIFAAEDTFHLTSESPAFPLDTRPITPDATPKSTLLIAESDPFPLDTRPIVGEQAGPTRLVAESPAFPLNTRPINPDATPQTTRLVAESDPFSLDTRERHADLSQSFQIIAETPPFALDTRTKGDDSSLLRSILESAPFALDTRGTPATQIEQSRDLLESASFTLNTLPIPPPKVDGFPLTAVSPPFALDTKSGYPTTPFRLTANAVGDGVNATVGALRFSPDGLRLAAAQSGRVRLWDLRSTRGPTTLGTGGAEITSMDFAPTGDQLLTGTADGLLRWWDPATRLELGRKSAGNGEAHAVYSKDGARVVAGAGSSLAVWRRPSFDVLAALRGSEGAVTAVALSPDNRFVLAGNSARTALLWNAETGALLARFTNHTHAITAVAFSPNSDRVLTASLDGSIRIWDLRTLREVAVIQQGSPVIAASWSLDGRLVVSGNNASPGQVFLWNDHDGSLRRVATDLSTEASRIQDIALSPDQTLLATSHSDGRVRLWDAGMEALPADPPILLTPGPETPLTLRSHGRYYFQVEVPSGRSLIVRMETATLGVKPQSLNRRAHGSSDGVRFGNRDLGARDGAAAPLAVTKIENLDITALQLFIAKDRLPNVHDFDTVIQATVANMRAEAPISSVTGGTYYVLALSPYLSDGAIQTRLSAAFEDFHLSAMAPLSGGNVGTVTAEIQGTGLNPSVGYRLVGAGGTIVAGRVALGVDSTRVFVTFDLRGIPPGGFELIAEKSGQAGSIALAQNFQVIVGTGPKLEVRLDTPLAIRAGRDYVAYLELSNVGDNDSEVPLLMVEFQGLGALRLKANGPNYTQRLSLFLPPQSDILPVYPPGRSTRIPLYFTSGSADIHFKLSQSSIGSTAFGPLQLDYSQLTRPTDFSETEWADHTIAIQQRYGVSLGQFLRNSVATGLNVFSTHEPSRSFVALVNGSWLILRKPSIGDHPNLPVPELPERKRLSLVGTSESRTGATPPMGGRDTYVVVITDEDYSRRPGTSDLPVRPDGQGVVDYFRVKVGLPESHIIWHHDGLGSADDLRANTVSEKIASVSSRGFDGNDDLVIVYSGHGHESGNWALNAGSFSPDDLASAIDGLGPRSAFVISDSCFSGAFLASLDAKLKTPLVGFAATDSDSISYAGSDATMSRFLGALLDRLNDGENLNDAMTDAQRDASGCGATTACSPDAFQQPQLFDNDGVDISRVPWDPSIVDQFIHLLGTAWNSAGQNLQELIAHLVRPIDPNDKLAPVGIGPTHAIAASDMLDYMIRFENDPKIGATAPVQELVVVDYLSAELDWTSVRFGTLSYGDRMIAIPPETMTFSTRDVPPTNSVSIAGRTQGELAVDVAVGLNPQTGRMEWRARAVDTKTGQFPEDALAGFLPHTSELGRNGYVTFSVKPKANTPLGTVITNIASIVFDSNDPIATPPVWNTIADIAPKLVVTLDYAAAEILPGVPFTYTLSFTNTSLSDLSGISITNTLPARLAVSTTATPIGQARIANGMVVWNVDSLAPGGSATLSVTATAGAEGEFELPVSGVANGGTVVIDQPGRLIVRTQAKPELSVSLIGNQLELTWPISVVGYDLQTTSTLSDSADWQPVGVNPSVNGNRWRIVLSSSQAAQYFRLVHP